MNKKVTLSVIAAILVLAALGLGGYLLKKKLLSAPLPKATQVEQPKNTQSKQQEPKTETVKQDQPQEQPQPEKKETTISGKVRSINEKQLYLELADGKGAAININATTPVKNEGNEKIGNLSLLKMGAKASITVNEKSDATLIVIEK